MRKLSLSLSIRLFRAPDFLERSPEASLRLSKPDAHAYRFVVQFLKIITTEVVRRRILDVFFSLSSFIFFFTALLMKLGGSRSAAEFVYYSSLLEKANFFVRKS